MPLEVSMQLEVSTSLEVSTLLEVSTPLKVSHLNFGPVLDGLLAAHPDICLACLWTVF